MHNPRHSTAHPHATAHVSKFTQGLNRAAHAPHKHAACTYAHHTCAVLAAQQSLHPSTPRETQPQRHPNPTLLQCAGGFNPDAVFRHGRRQHLLPAPCCCSYSAVPPITDPSKYSPPPAAELCCHTTHVNLLPHNTSQNTPATPAADLHSSVLSSTDSS